MAGGKWAHKVQTGAESTPGTKVNATAILKLRAPAHWVDGGVPVMPRYHDGQAVPGDDSYIPMLMGALQIPQSEAFFEQLDYVLSSALEDQETGTADGSGSSGYVRTYDAHGASNTALNSLLYRTIETGDNQQELEAGYCFVENLQLSGVAGEGAMIQSNWIGRQVEKGSFTGGIAVPAVEEILTSKGSMYIDASGGTIGSTQLTSTLLSWTLQLTTGWKAKFTADSGQLYFDFAYFDRDSWDATFNVVYEHNASAITEFDAFQAQTGRLIRLDIPGTAYGTAGTGTLFSGTKGLRLDMAGKYEAMEKLGERNGNSILAATFKPRYSGTDALAMQIKLANEISATT